MVKIPGCDVCRCPDGCVCPCEVCGESGKLPDGSPCRCARCPECGAADPFKPATADCSTCCAGRTELAQRAEIAAGWDPGP